MDRSKIYLWTLIAYAIALSIIVIGGFAEGTIDLVLTIATPMIAIILGIDALVYFGLKTPQSKGIIMLIASLALWLIADLVWIVQEEATFSSADIFYMLGYLTLFVGAVFGILTVKSDFFKQPKWLIAFFAAMALAIGIYYIFPMGWDAESSLIQNMVLGGYVLIDMLILVPVLFIIGFAFTGMFSIPWIVVAIGMLLNAGADFLYTIPEETLVSMNMGTIPDLGWYYAYLLIGLGFLLLKSKTEKILSA